MPASAPSPTGRLPQAGGLEFGLAEQAHTQWQHGDWEGLAAIPEAAIEAHPDRIRLALYAAAAHQQLGRAAAALHHAGLARAWGCSKQRLARWLLAGVHDTLGRAALALDQPPRAVEHFRQSLAMVAPADITRLALPLRLGAGCAHLGLPVPDPIPGWAGWTADSGHDRPAPARQPAAMTQAIEALLEAAEQLRRRHDELAPLTTAMPEVLADWRKGVETGVRREVSNMTRQLEAHADLQRWFDGHRMLPALHGWAISADFAHRLLGLFDAGGHDLIVEFGSGSSTVLLARAIQRARQAGRSGLPALLSFDHDEAYHRQTLHDLAAAGAAGIAEVVLAPLEPYRAARREPYPYYACGPALAAAAARLANPAPSLLVVVDGPPAVTGRHARYPAVPILLEHFPQARFELLIDDYKRRDEQEIVAKWLADFAAHGFEAATTELDLEKKACLLRAAKPPPPQPAAAHP